MAFQIRVESKNIMSAFSQSLMWNAVEITMYVQL